MPDVRVAINLPYLLLLPVAEYPTPAAGGKVQLREVSVPSTTGGPGECGTEASAVFAPHPSNGG